MDEMFSHIFIPFTILNNIKNVFMIIYFAFEDMAIQNVNYISYYCLLPLWNVIYLTFTL